MQIKRTWKYLFLSNIYINSTELTAQCTTKTVNNFHNPAADCRLSNMKGMTIITQTNYIRRVHYRN